MGNISPKDSARLETSKLGVSCLDMSEFEKGLVYKERMERAMAKYDYCRGIHGPDGGMKPKHFKA